MGAAADTRETATETPSFRERFRRWTRPPRRLKFTRAGKYFTGMTLLIGFGAINTGNNLLYLLLGMMLTLIIVSGVLSEAVLQKLTVRRRVPRRIFATHPTPIEISVDNGKQTFPSLSIQVVDRLEGVDAKQRPAAYFLRLDAGGSSSASYRYAFARRGLFKLNGFEVATHFPFELFRKSRDVDEELEFVVYPMPIEPPPVAGLTTPRFGEAVTPKPGHGGDFFALRDYRTGDDVRTVHWKVSAKRERLVVREFEQEETRVLTLAFANVRARGQDGRALASDDELERSVQACAGLAQRLLELGFSVGLATVGDRVSAGSGSAQLDRILRALALLDFLDPDVATPSFELHGEAFLVAGHSTSLSPRLAEGALAVVRTDAAGEG